MTRASQGESGSKNIFLRRSARRRLAIIGYNLPAKAKTYAGTLDWLVVVDVDFVGWCIEQRFPNKGFRDVRK